MITIHKYGLTTGRCTARMNGCAKFEVEMPEGAAIIHVAEQGDDIHTWAEVDTLADIEIRTFKVYPTGVEIDPEERFKHLATVMMTNGLVFHVYEDTEA